MTRTPTTAGRVEPVYGWAAVAPDGRMDISRLSITRKGARMIAAVSFARSEGNCAKALWSSACCAGWRVIRVQISPAGEREERS
jgi:hypothetical protein